MHLVPIAIATALTALCNDGSCAQTYSAVPIPQGPAVAMSSCGWITGNGAGGTTFLFHDGAFQQTMASPNLIVRGVNNYGDVVGQVTGGKIKVTTVAAQTNYGSNGSAGIHGSAVSNSTAAGVNDATVAAGTASLIAIPSKTTPFTSVNQKATTLENSRNAELAGINNGNRVVGTYTDSPSRAFVYDVDNGFATLRVTGARSTVGTAINDAGAVVGYGTTFSGATQGFVYVNGAGGFIGLSSGSYNAASKLVALNSAGQAVGSIQDASGNSRALLFTDGSLIDLNDVSDAPEPLVSAVGVSDAGEIAVNGASGIGYLLVPGGVYPVNTCKTR